MPLIFARRTLVVSGGGSAGERLLNPNEARGAGCRKAGQEVPAALEDLHVHVSP